MNLKNLLMLAVCVAAIDSILCQLSPAMKNKAEDEHRNSSNFVSNSNESQKLSGISSGHLSQCIGKCLCWSKSSNCSNICKWEESSCLKEEFSTCDAFDFSIKYNESGVEETYLCEKTTNSKAQETREKLTIIFGTTFICIMLITIAYLCMRIYQTRHETGAHEIPISLLMRF